MLAKTFLEGLGAASRRLRMATAASLLMAWIVPVEEAAAQVTNTNVVQFTSDIYFVNESSSFAVVTLFRTGDDLSTLVTVDYVTSDGTAVGGVDYDPVRATVTFRPGEVFRSFPIRIFNDFDQNGTRSFNVSLTDPTGAELGDPVVAEVLILDDELGFGANTAGHVEIARGNGSAYTLTGGADYYALPEEWNNSDQHANYRPTGPPGVEVTIIRRGGSRGRIAVDWQTTVDVAAVFPPSEGVFSGSGGLAREFVDFIPASGTVIMDDFQMSTNVIIRLPPFSAPNLLTTNAITNITFLSPSPKTFGVEITDARSVPEEVPYSVEPTFDPQARRVVIGQPIYGFSFYRAHHTVTETSSDGKKVVEIMVRRSPPYNEGVSVRYHVNPLRRLIVETGGDHLYNTFPLEAASDYAAPFVDFEPPASAPWDVTVDVNPPRGSPWNETEGIIRWEANETRDKPILLPILDDEEVEFNEDLWVLLWKQASEQDGFVSSAGSITIVKILYDEQPAGAADRNFNRHNDPNTIPPNNPLPGANNTVNAVATQRDGKVLIGGEFSGVNGITAINRIARMDFNGRLDPSFNAGLGADNFVTDIAVQPDGKSVIVGGFSSVNGILRRGIARLLTNGMLDTSFNPGLGADGPIRTLAIQADGKFLVGGEFLSFDGTNQNFLARLNGDGRLDTSFKVGLGPNGPVHDIALTAGRMEIDRSASGGPAEDRFAVDTGSGSGTVTINYDFLDIPDTLRVYYGGQQIFDSGLVSGVQQVTIPYGPGNATQIEVVMNEGSGLSGTLWFYDLVIDPFVDGRPVIGGNFTEIDGVPRNFIARLDVDGSVDLSFDPGTGTDGAVNAVAKQGNKIVLGGRFQEVDLRVRRGIARLNVDGSLDTGYQPGTGFDNEVFSLFVEPSGKVLAGGVFRSFNSTRRIGFARLNLDGSLDTTFNDTAYNQFAGLINPLSPENVESQENFIRDIAFFRSTNEIVVENILLDTNGMPVVTNNVTNTFFTTNLVTKDNFFVGGRFKKLGGGTRRDDILPRNNIARIIGGFTPGPGNLEFHSPEYSADENAGEAFVTLVRTNGSLGPVGVRLQAMDLPSGPGAALGGADFLTATVEPVWLSTWRADRQFSAALMGRNSRAFTTNRGVGDFNVYGTNLTTPLRFATDVAADDVFISLLDDTLVEGDETIDLTLSNPDGSLLTLGNEPIPLGMALGARDRAPLVIVDNDFSFGTVGFESTEYVVNEGDRFARITLTREGGNTGTVGIDYSTKDGTAIGGMSFDYTPSKGTVIFASGQTNASFFIPVRDDTGAELEETVFLSLTNAVGWPEDVPPSQRLDPDRSESVLMIVDNDFLPGRLSFSKPLYDVTESELEAEVIVRRLGGNLGELTVRYATEDQTAVAGVDYEAEAGLLRWVDGDTSNKVIRIPILDDGIVNESRQFSVTLMDPTVQGSADPNALGVQPATLVEIHNDDAFGDFQFSQELYAIDENGGEATVTVLRTGGIAGTNAVSFWTTNITAVPGMDYVSTNGVLTLLPGELSASFNIQILDDAIVEGNRLIGLVLSNAIPGGLGMPSTGVLEIVDNELSNVPAGALDTAFMASGTDDFVYALKLQSDGKILVGGDFAFINDVARKRLARLNANGTLDSSFDPLQGPDDSVRSIQIDGNGRIIVAGLFSRINNTNRAHLARLNIDGTIDPTFNTGAGPDNPVYAAVVQQDNRVVIGGEFAMVNGIERAAIARLATNGVVDASFDPGAGADGRVFALALQRDGKILVGGDFTNYNGVATSRLVRLRSNGEIDPTFNIGEGAEDSVRTIAVQSDGRILVGGLFTEFAGRQANRLVRLNQDGSIDESFNVGEAANGPVSVVTTQIDGKIIVGGDFTQFAGVTRNRLTRLRSDGTVDPTINFGSGANSTVAAIQVQPDRKIVIGGGFNSYNDKPLKRIARIHGGSIDGSGALEYSSPVFNFSETGGNTNATIIVRRLGGTTGSVEVKFRTERGSATPGVDYQPVDGVLSFPEGEVMQTYLVGVQDDDEVESDETVHLVLAEPSGGARLGPQPTATLNIVSDDVLLEFSRANYSVTENFVTGGASVTVVRRGSLAAALTVEFHTEDGTATAGADYAAVSQTVGFQPGQSTRNFIIPVLDDQEVEGNETVNLFLSSPSGNARLGISESTLLIVDNDSAPGQIEFASEVYTAPEGSGQARITVRRIGGVTGSVSVQYRTEDGPPPNGASSGLGGDYIADTGIVSFADGETEKSFFVTVIDDFIVEGNENVLLTLFNPTGGASLGLDTATLTIVDDDLGPGSLDESFDPGSGADGTVRALSLYEDGRMLLGGEFTSYDGTNRARVARIFLDGSLDSTFVRTNGPNNAVHSVALLPDEKILMGGLFNILNGMIHNRVVRLFLDGSLDNTFNLPLGLNAQVNVVTPQPDGKVLIGGVFDMASAAGRNRIARLNSNGTLDTSFNPGSGADDAVMDVALQSDGKILVAGAFSRMNGASRRGIVRLLPDGTIDATFITGAGANGAVHSVLPLDSGKIMIGGEFTAVNGVPIARVARLNTDGSLDESFDPGLGPNSVVRDLAVQPDGKVFIVGNFTAVDGKGKVRVARLNEDGSLDPAFDAGAGPEQIVHDVEIQADGRVVIVGAFRTVDRVDRNGIARLNGDARPVREIQFTTISRQATGAVTVRFTAEVGRSYQIDASENLEDWREIGTVNADASEVAFRDDLAAELNHRFYRVRRVGP